MANITYDENEDNVLNKKIREAYEAINNAKSYDKSFEKFKQICREIFELGFDDGQNFVWKVRQGKFDKIEPNKDLPLNVQKEIEEQFKKEQEERAKFENNLQMTVTTTDGETKAIDYVEMVSGKLVMKHGMPDSSWGTK
jgi:histidinol dehydrogenase